MAVGAHDNTVRPQPSGSGQYQVGDVLPVPLSFVKFRADAVKRKVVRGLGSREDRLSSETVTTCTAAARRSIGRAERSAWLASAEPFQA